MPKNLNSDANGDVGEEVLCDDDDTDDEEDHV